MKKLIIAIDGPAASGKGTLAKLLAENLSLAHLDTGLLYRAIGLHALEQKVPLDAEDRILDIAEQLSANDLNNTTLKRDDVGQSASKVALHPKVRTSLLDFQRRFAENPPEATQGCVLDGRDIGTAILPNADYKFYLTADVKERAQRRHKELLERNIEASYDNVLQEMQERDARDQARSTAPLKPADDAVLVDTTGLDAAEILQKIMGVLQQKKASGPSPQK